MTTLIGKTLQEKINVSEIANELLPIFCKNCNSEEIFGEIGFVKRSFPKRGKEIYYGCTKCFNVVVFMGNPTIERIERYSEYMRKKQSKIPRGH